MAMPGRYAALISKLAAPELEELAAILIAESASNNMHTCWRLMFPDWPDSWPREELYHAREQFRVQQASGYEGSTRLKECGRAALVAWHAPPITVICELLNEDNFYTVICNCRTVDRYLRRVRPLPAWILALLMDGDIHHQIVSQLKSGSDLDQDIGNLGNLGCVCRAWAGTHLEPHWRALVLSWGPRNPLVHLTELTWARKCRMLKQQAMLDDRARRVRRQRARDRVDFEYAPVCVATDAATGELIFTKRGYFESSHSLYGEESQAELDWDVKWDDGIDDADRGGVIFPARFFEERVGPNKVGWGACGTMRVCLLAVRERDERVMHLADFDVDLGTYRETDPQYVSESADTDLVLFYGGQRGGDTGRRLLLPALGLPAHEPQQDPAGFARIMVEFWGTRAGLDAPAPAVPSWRMTKLRFMFCSGGGTMEEAHAQPPDMSTDDGMPATELLSVFESGDWA